MATGADRSGFARRSPGPVARLVAAHLLTDLCEWASGIALLVAAFERSGATATGLTSLALLSPTLLGSPVAARLTEIARPDRVRRAGLTVQTLGFAGAALVLGLGAPFALAVACGVVALAAVALLRPTEAVLLPALVETPSQLTRATLWLSHCENASALLGPLATAAGLALGSSTGVLAGCTVASAAALALAIPSGPAGPAVRHDRDPGAIRRFGAFRAAFTTLRRHRRNVGLLGVVGAWGLVVGGLDVLLVVLAFDLDLGGTGAGLLTALLGGGAVLGSAVLVVLGRRTHVGPFVVVALALTAGALAAVGVTDGRTVAMVVLPLVGLATATADALGRLLLQRSAPPSSLGPVFALADLVTASGLVIGSALAQVLVALDGARVGLVGLAVATGLIGIVAIGALWGRADDADVPVVEMSLLRPLPMFEPLSPVALEAMCRTATYEHHRPGAVVIREGDGGDRFYAVARGSFDIRAGDRSLRVAAGGDFFGEVALLADVPRTATVTALEDGVVLAVERAPFLLAVTGSQPSLSAAWTVVRSLDLGLDGDTRRPDDGDVDLDERGPDRYPRHP